MSTITPTPTRTQPPGRSSRFVIDVALDMRNKGILTFFTDAWREYGDFVRIAIGPQAMYLASHPDHVKHVSITNRKNYDKGVSYDGVRRLLLGNGLVTSTGDIWRRQRRLLAPFFTPRGIMQFVPLILADGQDWIKRWERMADQPGPVEMMDEMMDLAASIILKAAFSSQSDAELAALKHSVDLLLQFVAQSQMNPLAPPLWVPTPRNRAYREAHAKVHNFLDDLISARRSMPEDEWPDDLMSKLMLAEDEESGERMDDQLVKDEVLTMFFAGHETTARTLTFTWYALSENPEVAARLHDEIDSQLGDAIPTVEDLKRLPYTLQVIKETLRLYPPAPLYARDAVADDEIDGYHVPAGARLILLPFTTHRHPDFWDEPERYDPDRFTPEREAAQHPYQYHPFAAGQRICIGNNFSLLESHILLALLARRFAPRLQAGHVPQWEMGGTLYSRNGMPMFIERR